MYYARLLLMFVIALCTVATAQDSRFLFNIGGGVGFPQGDMGKFVNTGGNFVVGGGLRIIPHVGVDTEFMWHDLPVNDATKQALNTPGASARQYAWTFNPIVSFPLGHHMGVYAIGGIGWYHRSGETTTPGAAVICDPYWSWWYGCTIGSVNFVTGSRSQNAFGENIGGGLTYRLGESHAKIYAEIRYHYAHYKTPTELLPLTFGVRW